MKQVLKCGSLLGGTMIGMLLWINIGMADDPLKIHNQDVDQGILNVMRISSSATLLVKIFDSSNANLGNPKHRDTAELLARTTPHLLAVDIVESLRESGFSEVLLDGST